MRKPLRIAGRILAGLLALVLLVVGVSYFVSASRLKKHYAVSSPSLVIPTDSASLARGHVFATLAGCTGCHTANLGGSVMINSFPFAKLAAPNLTHGRGGVASSYTDADWERAIRHGIRRDGTPLFIMPSDEFNRFRDEEVARIIAYVKSVPPVDRVTPTRTLYPLARALHTFGAPLVAAERIDHATQRNPAPLPAATIEYGAYLVASCKFCHGGNLGGQQVGGEPGAPPSPPIGPTAAPSRWTDEQFVQAMRTGVTPEGRKLRNEYMPWQAIGQLSDDELRALLMYLKKGSSTVATR
ncbi:MAG: c-type cytochrome [bacterium]